MIHTAIVYFLVDKCLDAVFDRIDVAIQPVIGTWVDIIDEDGDRHSFLNPVVLTIDHSDDSILILYERVTLTFADDDVMNDYQGGTSWISVKSWDARTYN